MKKPKDTDEKVFVGLRMEATDLREIDAAAKKLGIGRAGMIRMTLKKGLREAQGK